MADFGQFLICFLNFLLFLALTGADNVVEYNEDKRTCTYFEQSRSPMNEPGLVNCSWYVSSSCCKRTEVTSVFSSNMLPLYRASQDCHNKVNYLMCYFCSPDQYRWYKDGKVHVCETFCQSVHEACQDAYYDGTKIGDKYSNGTSFCEAQNFKTVNSKYCFKYDPTVFDGAERMTARILLQLAMFITLATILLQQL